MSLGTCFFAKIPADYNLICKGSKATIGSLHERPCRVDDNDSKLLVFGSLARRQTLDSDAHSQPWLIRFYDPDLFSLLGSRLTENHNGQPSQPPPLMWVNGSQIKPSVDASWKLYSSARNARLFPHVKSIVAAQDASLSASAPPTLRMGYRSISSSTRRSNGSEEPFRQRYHDQIKRSTLPLPSP